MPEGRTNSETAITIYAGPSRQAQSIAEITDPSKLSIINGINNFTAIQLPDGRRGFVETRFLNLPVKTLKLNQDDVPMYQSASLQSPIKTRLVDGVLIECIGSEVQADGMTWIPIRSPHGQTGYVRGDVKTSIPSRFHWLRNVSRAGLYNMAGGASLFFLGLLVTLGTFFLGASTSRGPFIYFFWYGPMLTGAGEFILGVIQLRESISIQRRKDRERRQQQ